MSRNMMYLLTLATMLANTPKTSLHKRHSGVRPHQSMSLGTKRTHSHLTYTYKHRLSLKLYKNAIQTKVLDKMMKTTIEINNELGISCVG